MDYNKVAQDIIDNVGGKANVKQVTHCFTRLRFILKDESKAKKDVVEHLEGVISVVVSGGQFQVVCGAKVTKIYDAAVAILGDSVAASADEVDIPEQKQSLGNMILQKITEIFTPLVPAIAAAGLIKGLLAAFAKIPGFDSTTSTYVIMNTASNVIFYFMPIFLAYTTAKALKCSTVISMILGAFICHPTIDALVQDVATKSTIFGLPVIKMEFAVGESSKIFAYTESVIPIILGVIVLYFLEKLLKKIIPEILQLILVPGLSLIIMVPVTFGVLGPVGIYIGNAIQAVYNTIIGFNVILGGALIGGLWCVFVAFGAHRALVPISFNDVAVSGRQTLMAMSSPANFAQGGAALGVMLRTKNSQLRSVAASTSLTAALAGITEPALYGCNLRLKKPMICAVISGAVGGAIIGWGGVYAESHVNGCLLTAVAYAAGGVNKFLIYLLGCGVAFFGAAALTFIVGFEDDRPDEETAAPEEKEAEPVWEEADQEPVEEEQPETADIRIGSPVKGKLISLKQVKDEVFATGALGKGAAVIPEKGEVVAPEDCQVSVLYETGHAIGLKLDSGAELLIHIGIDTVELGGRFFTKYAAQGARLSKGEKIVSFDIEKIRQAGYDPTVCLVVTNTEDYQAVVKAEGSQVDEGTDAVIIEKKKEE